MTLKPMQYHLQWSGELQAIERKFLTEIESLEKEIHPEHAPTFIGIIEKKIALVKEILGPGLLDLVFSST